ncbi:hypothetical protein BRARA_A03055 [Brassica rapa]|uniref:Uncharacterized protein n=1 Tax=Brassica campestris TaxID=3711 RepID=A0A398ARN0_BRACM|nr:hypothetical protein BRARA_A03055 [Brassica rapa]
MNHHFRGNQRVSQVHRLCLVHQSQHLAHAHRSCFTCHLVKILFVMMES